MLVVTLRTVIVYALIILAVRLMGKRQIGELQPGELVTTILISNLASLPIEETDLPLVSAVAPILIIICLEVVLSFIEIRSNKFSTVVSGNSKTVIRDGVIDQKQLLDLRFGITDVLEALRNKDIYDINDVTYAVIETNGQLNAYTEGDKPPLNLVLNGEVQKDTFKYSGLSDNWLTEKLKERSIELKDVLLMQYNTEGDSVTVVKREAL